MCKEVWWPDSIGRVQKCLLQSVSCFDLSRYNCWKNMSWTLKWLFCINFMLKKPCFKFQNLQHEFFNWKCPHLPPAPPPFGSFPKIRPFLYPNQFLSNLCTFCIISFTGSVDLRTYCLRFKKNKKVWKQEFFICLIPFQSIKVKVFKLANVANHAFFGVILRSRNFFDKYQVWMFLQAAFRPGSDKKYQHTCSLFHKGAFPDGMIQVMFYKGTIWDVLWGDNMRWENSGR